MAITVSGARMSTCSRRVLVCAHQFNADITFNEVASFEEIKTPAWIAKQPFGQMPVAEDSEGFVLYESRAIARYVVALAGGLPTDPKKLALLDQAISVEVSNFDTAASGIAFEKVFKSWKGLGDADEAKVAALTAKLATNLAVYETILSKQKYMAGDELTIADLFHLPYGKMAADLGAAPGLIDGSLPNVTRWWAELTALPAWKKANGEEAK